jgi:AsmA-like C-terminal region
MSLSSRGLAAEALAATGRGEGRVSLANADLKTIELMPKVASALTTVGHVLGFQVPKSLESTRIQSIETALRLENGRVVTPGLLLSGRDVAVTADGWIGFDKTLAYEGRVVLGPRLVQSLGFAGRGMADELGRVSVPFRVSGDVSSPNVDVDYSILLSLARRALAQQAPAVVRDVAGRIFEHVRERAGGIGTGPVDFLQRLFARSLGAVPKK